MLRPMPMCIGRGLRISASSASCGRARAGGQPHRGRELELGCELWHSMSSQCWSVSEGQLSDSVSESLFRGGVAGGGGFLRRGAPSLLRRGHRPSPRCSATKIS